MNDDYNQEKIIDFLCKAKKVTYAGKGVESKPSRPNSHDLEYSEGELFYLDSYLGGEIFSGEEAVWINGKPFWSMNYVGRITAEGFSGDFLKEALLNVPKEYPYRGPEYFKQGDYEYKLNHRGDFDWFNGREDIFYKGIKVYECLFHGGKIK